MDIYNPFIDEDRAAGDFELLNGYLTATNDIIHLTETKMGIRYARVYDAFNISNGAVVDPASKKLLAFDHFHPNAAGQVIIAEKLTALGFSAIFP